MSGNCVVCGKETKAYCDGDECGVYVCSDHYKKPYANKNDVLCPPCFKKFQEEHQD